MKTTLLLLIFFILIYKIYVNTKNFITKKRKKNNKEITLIKCSLCKSYISKNYAIKIKHNMYQCREH